MSLTLTLDPAIRLIVEPGFDQEFSTVQLAQQATPADAYSAQNLWADPAFGTIMLKPRQLDPDFLNHQAQLSALLRLGSGLVANPTDVSTHVVYEASVGNTTNPWIAHSPVAVILPFPGLSPLGITPHYTLTDIQNTSEGTGLMVPLVDSQQRFPANVGFFFRWYVPRTDLAQFPTVYGIAVGQYFLVLRDTLVEVYQDVSLHGDRTKWQKLWVYGLFGSQFPQANPYNADWTWGQNTAPPPTDQEHSLLILPFRRNRVLLQAQNHGFIDILVRSQPRLLPDGSDWDILRSDSIQVWALSAVPGRFQLQKVVYAAQTATLNTPLFKTEYTPLANPTTISNSDRFYDEQLLTTLSFPPNYTFPTNPVSNDCPPATTFGTGQSRQYGVSLHLRASSDGLHSPQFYSLDIHVEPVFMDSPAPAKVVSDQTGAPVLMSAEVSLGTKPGDGHMRATVQDPQPPGALAAYYYRTEMPVQLQLLGTPVFTGYTERLQSKPLRQTNAPVEMSFTAVDRWLLLETSYLRDQKDWSGDGHISAVDAIARQCGIDTNNPPAEYPAGWNGAQASVYNTPLDTPVIGTENLTGQQLLGWKPQPFDTGASFLRRIAEFFSGWLLGFRLDGTLFYLPYTYFTTSSLTFFASSGQFIQSGLTPNLGMSAGLTVHIDPGTYVIGGQSFTYPGGSSAPVAGDGTSTLFVNAAGQVNSNTTGMAPAGAVVLGSVTTAGGALVSADTSAASGRQLATSPKYRSPVEFRTIEPTGNVVQAVTHYLQDFTYNRSGLFVDFASVRNPQATNYLGRYKWFIEEVQGAFTCPQLNAMAYLTFQRARARRKRVVFDADFVPSLKIGQVFTLDGYGQFRLLELTARLLKSNWEVCTYTAEELGPSYTAQAGTGGEEVKEFSHSLHAGIRRIIDEQYAKRGIRASPTGRFLQTNVPIEGNNKAVTQPFTTTGYDAVKGQTTVPFTVGLSPVGGSDTLSM